MLQQDDEIDDFSTLVTKAIRMDINDASKAYSFDKQVVCDHLNSGHDFYCGPSITHS